MGGEIGWKILHRTSKIVRADQTTKKKKVHRWRNHAKGNPGRQIFWEFCWIDSQTNKRSVSPKDELLFERGNRKSGLQSRWETKDLDSLHKDDLHTESSKKGGTASHSSIWWQVNCPFSKRLEVWRHRRKDDPVYHEPKTRVFRIWKWKSKV